MINEFLEYKEYMEVYDFYKKYRNDQYGYFSVKDEAEKNIRFSSYLLRKSFQGYLRPLTIVARYCLFHDEKIKNISDINEKIAKTTAVLDDWYDNVIVAFYELLAFQDKNDNKKTDLLEKAKLKRKNLIETQYMCLRNDACSYKTIIAEALEVGELRGGEKITLNTSIINYIKRICTEDKGKKGYRKYAITLIAFICYYKVYYKTDADEDGFVNVTLFDFCSWLGRKAGDEINDILNKSKNIEENLISKQSEPYKFKIDLGLLESNDNGGKEIVFEDTGKKFARDIEEILKNT